jgi:hypothetical protein
MINILQLSNALLGIILLKNKKKNPKLNILISLLGHNLLLA